jgi:predicted phage terminase large subunit-like protein
MQWDIVYEKAIRDDGSLLFPERLTKEFLEQARRTQGSYIFSHQYLNQVIPQDQQTFQPHWLRYWIEVPTLHYNFAFIDPAISEEEGADYTALVVVSVDKNQQWYCRHTSRQRINPSKIIDLMFAVNEQWHPKVIGVEDVAFQRAIIHFGFEEMKRRGVQLPLQGVKRSGDKTKEMRILSLVPRFEWGTLLLTQGCHDLEQELAEFPFGGHDDVLDALSSIAEIVSYPKERPSNEKPSPHDPNYESWYRQQLLRRANQGE